MTQRTIVLATLNEGKVRELQALLSSVGVQVISLAGLVGPGYSVDETGSTFAENAWLKAASACKETGLPAVADDSGIEVDALDGAPGVYSARFAGAGANDDANNALLLARLESVPDERRGARFVAALSLAMPGETGPVEVATARGVLEGRVIRECRGTGGFGYDRVFEARVRPGRTTAELEAGDKNSISHRGQALRQLLPRLVEHLESGVRF